MYFGDADYNCNWRGGYAVVDIISPYPPGFSSAGWTNITNVGPNSGTPLNGLIGEVRQSSTTSGSNYAFVRIFESGHEVPFYQPAGSLAMLERVIKGLDIATGMQQVNDTSYTTSGPMVSSYREGNGTVQYDVLDGDEWVYDVGTGMPVNSTIVSLSSKKRTEIETEMKVKKRGEEMRMRRGEVLSKMGRRKLSGRRNLSWGRRG